MTTPVRPTAKAAGVPCSQPVQPLQPCAFPACGRPRYRRDLCQSHYRQDLAGVPLQPIRNPGPVPCSVDGCDTRARSGGMCNLHYQRKRNGVPLDGPIQRRAPKRAPIKPSPADMDRYRALDPAAKIHTHAQLRHVRRLVRIVLGPVFGDVATQIERTIDDLAALIRDDLNQRPRRKAA